MRILFVLGTVALLLFLMRPQTTPAPSLPKERPILAAGDSLTYGYGASHQTESYPAYLSKWSGYTVINAGLNGETSAEGLERLPYLLKKHNPSLTILCYGGNDILQNLPMETLRQNLKRMIAQCRASGSKVLLVSVPNFTLFGLEPLPLYEEVAKETDTPLIEGVLATILNDPALKSDQVHPNAKGYEKLAEAIYGKLKEEGWIKAP